MRKVKKIVNATATSKRYTPTIGDKIAYNLSTFIFRIFASREYSAYCTVVRRLGSAAVDAQIAAWIEEENDD